MNILDDVLGKLKSKSLDKVISLEFVDKASPKPNTNFVSYDGKLVEVLWSSRPVLRDLTILNEVLTSIDNKEEIITNKLDKMSEAILRKLTIRALAKLISIDPSLVKDLNE